MRLIAHLLDFPLLSYYTYSPYWCTCQGQETQSKHISKTYTLMLKSIIHLSLMHTDVCLQHNSLLPQTVGGRECSILTTTQCTASTDCWRKEAYHTDINTMHHSHRQSKTQWRFFTFWHCCGKGMCCISAMLSWMTQHHWQDDFMSTIFNWIMVIVFDTLFKVSPALMSPFRSYCYWNLDAIQQLLAWWEDGIRGRQLHNLERVLLGWLPQMKLIIVFCYSK